MVAEGFEDRILYLLAAAAVTALVLMAFWLTLHLGLRRKTVQDEFTMVKLVVAQFTLFQFAAAALALSLIALVISLFLSDRQAGVMRYLSLVPFVILGWVGIVQALWKFFTLKAPPTEEEYARAEAAVERTADCSNGWPAKPAYRYRGNSLELALVSILWAIIPAILISVGALVLLNEWVPGLVPKAIAERALRSAGDPITGGLTALGLGCLGAVAGGILLFGAWKKLLRTRPLSINERGIYAFRRGRPWRFLPWDQVTSITKHRRPDDHLFNPRFEIQIDGPGVSLLVTIEINDLGRVRQLLSRYARAHSIQLRLIDKGSDTMKAQRKLLPPERYKEITRTGLISEVAEL